VGPKKNKQTNKQTKSHGESKLKKNLKINHIEGMQSEKNNKN
jgi:hypothetical protein